MVRVSNVTRTADESGITATVTVTVRINIYSAIATSSAGAAAVSVTTRRDRIDYNNAVLRGGKDTLRTGHVIDVRDQADALVYVGQRWSLLAEPAKDADGCGDVAVGMTLLAA